MAGAVPKRRVLRREGLHEGREDFFEGTKVRQIDVPPSGPGNSERARRPLVLEVRRQAGGGAGHDDAVHPVRTGAERPPEPGGAELEGAAEPVLELGGLVEAVVDEGDIPGAMFVFLENFPFSTVTSAVGVLIVVLFFITSIDSAALVMDTMGSGHEEESPVHQRVFWVVAIGVIAAILLTATGATGLAALQNVAILIGLPFFVLGYVMIYSLLRALREDAGEVGVLPTRQWRRVLPPEEFHRRTSTGAEVDEEYVVAPDYVHGSEPANAPAIEHPEQPDYVREYRTSTGSLKQIRDIE